MVATLLSLRWASLRHNLRREPWRAVLLGLGLLWCLALLPTIVMSGFYLGMMRREWAETSLTLAGTVFTLGWLIIPVILPSLDDTLDVERFAGLGINARRLAPGLLVASLVGLPTLVAGVVTLVPVVTWLRAGEPGAVAVALVAAPLGWAICLLGARAAAVTTRRVLATRAARRASALVAGAVFVALAAGAKWVADQGLELALEKLPDIPNLLGWTPLAATWAAPIAAARGEWGGVAGRLAVAAVAVALAAWWWTRAMDRWLTAPPPRSGMARRRRDGILGRVTPAPDGQGGAAVRDDRRHGWAAVSTIARRTARSWATDPRYLASLGSAVALPAVLALLAWMVLGSTDQVFVVVGVVMAGSLGWGRHNEVAYDGTALWLHVTAAVPGWADRLGRALGTAVWAVPFIALVAAGGTVAAGNGHLAPAVTGTSDMARFQSRSPHPRPRRVASA